ncbi:MAG: DNA methyltransferase [Methylococcaceae bacterium]|nr:DNA methyltransferase [Methylococcaceae bacterium]
MKIRDRIKDFRRVKASELAPNPKNWRTHPQEQQDALRGVLAEIGYADALIAREVKGGGLELIDGHLRAETTPDEIVPVLVLDLTKKEADKLLATLDPLASMAEANAAALEKLLGEIETDSQAVQAMLDELAADSGIEQAAGEPVDAEPQIDRAAELQKEWGTETGQIWEVVGKAGTHRVMCGDSTKAEDVGRLMGGEKANCLFTDPPYNVDYDGNYIQSGKILDKSETIWSGNSFKDSIKDFGAWMKNAILVQDGFLSDGAAVYLWHPPGAEGRHFWAAWPWDRWHFQCDLVWNKTSLIISRWDYKPQHEPVMYGWKGKNRSWVGPNNEPTVLDHARQQGASGEERLHPTAKPLPLVARLLANHGTGLTYDPFLGSGTTLIAAEQLSRVCYGMEISPAYVGVILQRAKDCGLEPRLTKAKKPRAKNQSAK